jgi:hypothetical protein
MQSQTRATTWKIKRGLSPWSLVDRLPLDITTTKSLSTWTTHFYGSYQRKSQNSILLPTLTYRCRGHHKTKLYLLNFIKEHKWICSIYVLIFYVYLIVYFIPLQRTGICASRIKYFLWFLLYAKYAHFPFMTDCQHFLHTLVPSFFLDYQLPHDSNRALWT